MRGGVIVRCSSKTAILDIIIVAWYGRYGEGLATLDGAFSFDSRLLLLIRGFGLFKHVDQMSALVKQFLLGCAHRHKKRTLLDRGKVNNFCGECVGDLPIV